MTACDLSPAAVSRRLAAASRASGLGPQRGVAAKVGASPAEISARLRQVARLRELCRRLGAIGAAATRPR